MPGPRIGSLFTGTGMLDLAVMDVYGGDVVWHSQYEPPGKDGREDKNQYAAQILKRHWPAAPNLGDITKVCWQCVLDLYGQVDILTGGFPCTDVSSAGLRVGLLAGTRSGLWAHMAHAIRVLRPRLVVIENVQGLLSAKADRGMGPGGTPLDEDPGAGGVLRALGAVLGDLATLGFDAEWVRIAASEVGAAHPRRRVFILAWPAVQDPDIEPGSERGIPAPGQAQGGRARPDTGGRGGAPAAHTCGVDAERRGVAGVLGGTAAAEPGQGLQRERAGNTVGHRGQAPADTDRRGLGPDQRDLRAGQSDTAWGDFEPAIRRWEAVLGRPAPGPLDALGRLSTDFTEWLMGLPDGWVTGTPGLTRPAMLKALGNGVVRLQGATAIRQLEDRRTESPA